MKVAMIGHKDFPSRSGGVEVMVGGLAASLVRRGYEVTVYNRGLQKGHKEIYRGQEYEVNLVPKIKVETVICEIPVERVLEVAEKVL